jgi:glycine/serine hydroxymethyltransferase
MRVEIGQLIQLRACGDRRIFRRFVGEQNGTILICSNQEYKSALREKREPLCVGFPLADVIGVSTRETLRLQFERNQSRVSARAGRAAQR